VSAQPWLVHAASGLRRDVARTLFALPQAIIASPLYVLFLTGEQGGTIHLFECLEQDERRAVISVCRSPLPGDIPRRALAMLAARMWADEADGSPQTAISALLKANCSFRSSAPARAPGTPRAAFGLPLDSTPGAELSACVLAC
jgi:hypothetical protein